MQVRGQKSDCRTRTRTTHIGVIPLAIRPRDGVPFGKKLGRAVRVGLECFGMNARKRWVLLPLILACAWCCAQTNGTLRFDIGAVDKSADPCGDFYQYACGGWMKHNPIPSNRAYWAVFQQMRDVNQKRVAAILEESAEGARNSEETPGSADRKRIGDYYRSCMDEKSIEAKDLGPLRAELEKIDAIRNVNDLATEVGRLQGLGTDALFGAYPDQKLEDATQVILYLDQSGLNLPEVGYYTSDDGDMVKARAGYRAHLQWEFELLGEKPEHAAAAADDVVKIESTLARAELTPVERRDRKLWYHETTLSELRKLAPAFPWETYFATIGVSANRSMNVAVTKYMEAINGLVEGMPTDAWKEYLRWELVRVATPELPKRFRDAEFDFYQHTLGGVKEESPRVEQCTAQTNQGIGEAVGREYVKRYFASSSKARVVEMVGRITEALRSDFEQIPWMSAKTRQEAIRKLELLRAMIGYPEHWRDYSQLTTTRGDALGNLFRAQGFEFRRQLAKIGQPVDRGEFYELPQSVEGYHDNPLNEIVFTAGILQPPFFDPQIDDAVNFGLAGAVMGHELSHAFDDKGHQFDGEGNMRNWWTPEDAAHYDDRAACFVRQYSAYTAVDDLKVNGQLTLGENIADNGGMQLAYMAFENAAHSKSVEERKIDGYTPEQRFFLGWAQWRCMNITDAKARELARDDPHSPGRWRVNGVVSNMPGFQKAYGCRKGDRMVNAEPCRIW
jgi:putative endopeptidase